jgi:hypothetical protein
MSVEVRSSGLWSDEPDKVDLLAFSAVAETVIDAILDEVLDPVAIGVSGSWGSGKTTVLRLVESGLRVRNLGPDKQILVVPTDPWRYDPSVGAKETLIGEILDAIKAKLQEKEDDNAASKALAQVKKLAKRVQWAKGLKLATRTALTFQLPKPENLTELIAEPDGEGEGEPRGLDQFRADFAELMDSKPLQGVERLVVLVDDLDRCLPETVIETLETMRLFLAVPRMAFVLAADEDRVADALRARFPAANRPAEDETALPLEEPASLYLHKIVQTTVPIPALSRFDTQAYLVLLQLSHVCEPTELESYIRRCDELRRVGELLDDLGKVSKDRDIAAEMAFAARLTPLLYEKLRGNPRRIKRFLNDLRVRQSVAGHRGIELEPDVVAKMMVLEKLIKDGLTTVLDWLAKGELREQIRFLEKAADRPDIAQDAEDVKAAGSGRGRQAGKDQPKQADRTQPKPEFTDDLVRWAKLPPTLSSLDLAPYLYLAASFSGLQVLDTGLPIRLRDLAANLLSTSRVEQKSVTDSDLEALNKADVTTLLSYLARVARDQPASQLIAVKAMLRIVDRHPDLAPAAADALGSIPVEDLRVPAVTAIGTTHGATFAKLIKHWHDSAAVGPAKNALGMYLESGAGR